MTRPKPTPLTNLLLAVGVAAEDIKKLEAAQRNNKVSE